MSTLTASTQAPLIKNYIRGDSRDLKIQIYQSDGVTPFDLTGCEVFFTVNTSNDPTGNDDSSAAISVKTSAFTNPTSGLATLTITNVASQNTQPGTYYYDIQLKDTNGDITSLAQNRFLVIADITRSIS